MTDVPEISGLRAADHDRQEVVDRLRTALDDGRLTLDEYLDRMGRAYQAVTYADLALLCADLPVGGRAGATSAAKPAVAASPASPWCGAFGRLPGPLRVLWTIWLIAVSVNVVVWLLVSVTTASLIYPWPLWVAGPYGAVLLALSAGRVRPAGQASERASRR
ncbi:MAG TPA: DUF1707 domain-containing protein [Streptosporangiaceae bacterium]|nr:DUF1707 domain-containing protein [Streptosporangiaceae bacterium]